MNLLVLFLLCTLLYSHFCELFMLLKLFSVFHIQLMNLDAVYSQPDFSIWLASLCPSRLSKASKFSESKEVPFSHGDIV